MELDPRGQRFAATVTAVVLVVVLATGWGWLALAQAAVFAITAADPRRGPYALIFRTLIAPRLGPPAEREPAAPVRFAQVVGLVFLAVASIGYLSGVPALGSRSRRWDCWPRSSTPPSASASAARPTSPCAASAPAAPEARPPLKHQPLGSETPFRPPSHQPFS
jgi:hypothetical protein